MRDIYIETIRDRMNTISEVIRNFPTDLQDPILQFWDVIKDELGVKREDFTELKKIVSDLAEAQKELAQAQKETEKSIKHLSDTVEFKLGGLGRRWGIDSESSFRSGLREILTDTGYIVQNYIDSDSEGFVFGRPAEIEIDIILKGDKTIVVEIKSSVSKSDVFIFMKKADFYQMKSGRNIDTLLMITPYIDDAAREIAKQYTIIICDSLADIGPSIQKA